MLIPQSVVKAFTNSSLPNDIHYKTTIQKEFENEWLKIEKSGFHGALSLIMLVPIGNIVLPFVLAFADWPAMKT